MKLQTQTEYSAYDHGKTAALKKNCPEEGASCYLTGSRPMLAFLRGYIDGLRHVELQEVRRNKIAS